MNAADLRAILSRLALSQVRAAHCLGVNDRTMRRWLKGDLPIPRIVAFVLMLADRGSINLADLLEVKSDGTHS